MGLSCAVNPSRDVSTTAAVGGMAAVPGPDAMCGFAESAQWGPRHRAHGPGQTTTTFVLSESPSELTTIGSATQSPIPAAAGLAAE